MLCCALVKKRFLGFAVGHLAASLLGFLVYWGFGALLSGGEEKVWCLTGMMMLLYVPAGAVTARLKGWPLPGRREGALAVLLPALCAWAWAYGGWGMIMTGIGREADTAMASVSVVGFCLLLSSVLLASPSFCMMLTIFIFIVEHPESDYLLWYGGIFLAGLLPPLLFFLGSLLGARSPAEGETKGGEGPCPAGPQ